MGTPLAGIKVVEVAEFGFVPSAAAVLADWGAEVVKVERPGGDPMREHSRMGLLPRPEGFDVVIEHCNRNKRGIALDLRAAGGRAALDRLIREADVFVTNYLPATRAKLRIQPDDVFAVNPSVVYARGSGQGQRGPDAEAGGFDGVSFWGRGGVGNSLQPPDGPLVMPRPAMGDGPSGMFLAGGIAAALLQRERTGKPVIVDVSLLAGAIWTLAPDLSATSVTGEEQPRVNAMTTPMGPLIGPYRTADERWLLLNMLDGPGYWDRACRAFGFDNWLGQPERNVAESRSRFTETIASAPIAHWDARLRAEGGIFSKLATPPEVLDDPQVHANGYMPRHPGHPRARVAANPVQFDGDPMTVHRGAPEVGEHTREVLTEAGMTDAEIDALVADGSAVAP